MFIAKLKATLATIIILGLVGAGGLVYSGGGSQGKSQGELEKLRRENELLQVNVRALLERIQTLEKQAERTAVRDGARLDVPAQVEVRWSAKKEKAPLPDTRRLSLDLLGTLPTPDAYKLAEATAAYVARLQAAGAGDKDAVKRTIDVLEKAVKELREQEKKPKQQ